MTCLLLTLFIVLLALLEVVLLVAAIILLILAILLILIALPPLIDKLAVTISIAKLRLIYRIKRINISIRSSIIINFF